MTQPTPITHMGIPVRSVCFPRIPADDTRFVWTAGGDVQSVWRRFGWKPLEETMKRDTND